MQTIRKKLIIGVLTITLASCLVLSGINIFIHLSTANDNAQTLLNSSAEAYSLSIANGIDVFKAEVKSMAADTRITKTATMAELANIGEELAAKYNYDIVSFAAADGTTYDGLANISTRDYFIGAESGETYISSPLVSARDNSTVLYVATKVDNSSNYGGIVFAQLANDEFSSIMQGVSLGDSGYGFMIDKSGTIVAHNDNSLVTSFTNYSTLAQSDKSYKEMGEIISTMLKEQTGMIEGNFEGKDRMISFKPVSGTDGWILAMAIDKSEVMESFSGSLTTSIILIIVFAALGIAFTIIFANTIANPITAVSNRIQLLSEGDLHTPIPDIKSKDEVGTLAKALDSTIQSLNAYISDIHHILSEISGGNLHITTDQSYVGDFANIKTDMQGIVSSMGRAMTEIAQIADQVATGSEQIANSSTSLSQGTTEQASAIEQFTASLKEVADQTDRNAQNAEKANDFMAKTKHQADTSNSQVSEMLKAMDAINEASSNIGKIIKTIDDIAFQTNILALNAAVEAARAGSSGKGFAVVADEVRVLAARSANAAQETTELIKSSITKVSAGMKIANETADNLSEIVAEIEKTAGFISEIALASREQAQGVAEIDQGIGQISAVVQTNAATSEELAASSEELTGQSNVLKDTIAYFKV